MSVVVGYIISGKIEENKKNTDRTTVGYLGKTMIVLNIVMLIGHICNDLLCLIVQLANIYA